VPAHSHKFIATLQAAQAGPSPVLTRIDTNAGHGAGKPTAKIIQEQADVLGTLLKERLNVAKLETLRISPVLGVHTGPGIVGVAIVPVELMNLA